MTTTTSLQLSLRNEELSADIRRVALAIADEERYAAEELRVIQEVAAKISALMQEKVMPFYRAAKEAFEAQHSLKMRLIEELAQTNEQVARLEAETSKIGALTATYTSRLDAEAREWSNKERAAKTTLVEIKNRTEAWEKFRAGMSRYKIDLFEFIFDGHCYRHLMQHPDTKSFMAAVSEKDYRDAMVRYNHDLGNYIRDKYTADYERRARAHPFPGMVGPMPPPPWPGVPMMDRNTPEARFCLSVDPNTYWVKK